MVDLLEDAYVNYHRRTKYYPTFFGESYTGPELEKLFGIKLNYTLFAFRDGFGYYIVDRKVWQKCTKVVSEIVLADPTLLDKYFDVQEREYDKAVSAIAETLERIGQFSSEELVDLLKKIATLFIKIQAQEDTVAYFTEPFVHSTLETALNSKYPDRQIVMEVMNGLTDLDHISFINQELFELALIAKDRDEEKLAEHCKKWRHFRFDYFGPIVTDEEFEKRYADLVADSGKNDETITRFTDYDRKMRERKAHLVDKYCLDRETISLSDLGAKIGWLIDRKKNKVTKLAYTIDEIIAVLASRLEIPKEWLHWMLPDEIYQFVDGKNKFDEADFSSRKHRSVVKYEDGKCTDILFDGPLFDQADNLVDKYLSETQGIEAKGLSACPGVYRGNVAVILSPEDAIKAFDGMVMVSPKTTVDFVHLMRQAGAVVSDFGGLTSHTAIIARELKIPAVVGTGSATQTFKDGDLVEVDADKGIVRKI